MKTKITKKKINIFFLSCMTLLIGFYVAANYDPSLFNDTDQDGLSDAEENTYGTDPNNRDSDDDGYSDGVEVKSGYDPLKPAPGDKIVKENINEKQAAPQGGLTNKFINEFDSLIKEKDGSTITTEEIDTFLSERLTDELKDNFINNELPEINKDEIAKISASSNSPEDELNEKQKIFADYISEMGTIFAEAKPLDTDDDEFGAFFLEFKNKTSLSSSGDIDKEYIRNIALKSENFVNKALKEVEVPKDFLSVHVSILREMLGFAQLKEYPYLMTPEQDKISNIIVLARIRHLMGLVNETLTGEFKAQTELLLEN